jgi:hypothetical protein
MTNRITKLVDRLDKIGINVEFVGNFPWIYLDKVNGVKVTELYRGNHGFTAFFIHAREIVWSDRRVVFNKIREMVKK